ncbi:MAG: hypothetical protein K0S33_3087 [Bacteroidetes bacterium]|jgi:hypothetical protein|nr:hypothetical protein [Bacteroidota bacterium]
MKQAFLLTFVLLNIVLFSQTNTPAYAAKLDSITKNKFIFSTVSETYSSSHSTNGGLTGGTARGISVYFHVGRDGYLQNIGRKSKNLLKAIKDDPEAVAELNNAKKHLRKKRLYNTLEYVSYAVTLGGAITLFVGLDKREDTGESGLAAGGGVLTAAGFGGIIGFHRLTDKEMDSWRDSIKKAVEIYNQNLLAKIQ